jgi:hypothetical protein
MGYPLQKEDAMRLATPGKILFFVLLLLPAERMFTQSAPQAPESQNFVSVEMSLNEFQRRLLPWLVNHPDLATPVVTKGQFTGEKKRVGQNFYINFPTLDIYSSAGVPLYFSDYAEAGLQVIDALPQVIPEANLDPKYKLRPSLREALSMVPGIPRKDWATPAQFDYTIFAIIQDHKPVQSTDASAGHAKKKATYQQNMNESGPDIEVIKAPPVSPEDAQRNALANQSYALANKAQDEALQRLKTRLNGSRIRVIELHLTQQ